MWKKVMQGQPMQAGEILRLWRSDIRFACDMRLAARDMCAKLLFFLIKPTDSSAVINSANEEYAHAKYFDPV